SFFFHHYFPHPHLHSFPTRRSSDLRRDPLLHLALACQNHLPRQSILVFQPAVPVAERIAAKRHENFSAIGKSHAAWQLSVQRPRSEEHTSELQSRFDLVCRLLLEKK